MAIPISELQKQLNTPNTAKVTAPDLTQSAAQLSRANSANQAALGQLAEGGTNLYQRWKEIKDSEIRTDAELEYHQTLSKWNEWLAEHPGESRNTARPRYEAELAKAKDIYESKINKISNYKIREGSKQSINNINIRNASEYQFQNYQNDDFLQKQKMNQLLISQDNEMIKNINGYTGVEQILSDFNKNAEDRYRVMYDYHVTRNGMPLDVFEQVVKDQNSATLVKLALDADQKTRQLTPMDGFLKGTKVLQWAVDNDIINSQVATAAAREIQKKRLQVVAFDNPEKLRNQITGEYQYDWIRKNIAPNLSKDEMEKAVSWGESSGSGSKGKGIGAEEQLEFDMIAAQDFLNVAAANGVPMEYVSEIGSIVFGDKKVFENQSGYSPMEFSTKGATNVLQLIELLKQSRIDVASLNKKYGKYGIQVSDNFAVDDNFRKALNHTQALLSDKLQQMSRRDDDGMRQYWVTKTEPDTKTVATGSILGTFSKQTSRGNFADWFANNIWDWPVDAIKGKRKSISMVAVREAITATGNAVDEVMNANRIADASYDELKGLMVYMPDDYEKDGTIKKDAKQIPFSQAVAWKVSEEIAKTSTNKYLKYLFGNREKVEDMINNTFSDFKKKQNEYSFPERLASIAYGPIQYSATKYLSGRKQKQRSKAINEIAKSMAGNNEFINPTHIALAKKIAEEKQRQGFNPNDVSTWSEGFQEELNTLYKNLPYETKDKMKGFDDFAKAWWNLQNSNLRNIDLEWHNSSNADPRFANPQDYARFMENEANKKDLMFKLYQNSQAQKNSKNPLANLQIFQLGGAAAEVFKDKFYDYLQNDTPSSNTTMASVLGDKDFIDSNWNIINEEILQQKLKDREYQRIVRNAPISNYGYSQNIQQEFNSIAKKIPLAKKENFSPMSNNPKLYLIGENEQIFFDGQGAVLTQFDSNDLFATLHTWYNNYNQENSQYCFDTVEKGKLVINDAAELQRKLYPFANVNNYSNYYDEQSDFKLR